MIPLLLACVLLAPSAANAGFFIGASFGRGDVTIPAESVRLSTTETSYKGFVGYSFTKFWGLEASYTKLGSPSSTVDGVDIEADLDGFTGYLDGFLPVSPRVFLFGKIGYAAWDVEARFTENGETEQTSPDGNGFAWGIGAAYRFTSSVAVRVEYETLSFDDDLKFATIGVQYEF